MFWAAVAVLAALFPITVLCSWPYTIPLILIDFLVAVALVCIWLEKKGKPLKPLDVVWLNKEDLEKVKEHVKVIPTGPLAGLPVLVMEEEKQKKLKEHLEKKE